MKTHNHTPSISSPHKKSYAQVAEQVLFLAVLSGFFVMAGGFIAEVLSFHAGEQMATAPAHVMPEKAEPPCGPSAAC